MEMVLTASDGLIRQRAHEPERMLLIAKDSGSLEEVIQWLSFGGDEKHGLSQRKAQGSPHCLLLPPGP